MPRPIPRSLRLLDLVSLALLIAGAGLYVYAWLGLRELKIYTADPEAPLFDGVDQFTHFWELSRIGVWLVLAGVGLAVITAIGAVILGRR